MAGGEATVLSDHLAWFVWYPIITFASTNIIHANACRTPTREQRLLLAVHATTYLDQVGSLVCLHDCLLSGGSNFPIKIESSKPR